MSARKSIVHSHVLPPDKAWPILCKLLHKACERLRSHGLLASCLTMQLAFYRGVSLAVEQRLEETDATLVIMRAMDRLWRERPEPRSPLLQVPARVNVILARNANTAVIEPQANPVLRKQPAR